MKVGEKIVLPSIIDSQHLLFLQPEMKMRRYTQLKSWAIKDVTSSFQKHLSSSDLRRPLKIYENTG